jgi:hypothetical protein
METHPVEVSLAKQCVPVPVDCTGLGIARDRIMAQITGDVRATDELCRMSEHNEKKDKLNSRTMRGPAHSFTIPKTEYTTNARYRAHTAKPKVTSPAIVIVALAAALIVNVCPPGTVKLLIYIQVRALLQSKANR